METNERVKLFLSTLKEIKGALKEGNANEAFKNTSYCVQLCEEVLKEAPYDNNRKNMAMNGYVTGANFVHKILNLEYSLVKHHQGRQWAETGILLAFQFATEKKELKEKLDFLDAMEKGLWLGQTDIMKQLLDVADCWVNQMLESYSNNEEVIRICRNYKTAKEHSKGIEDIFQKIQSSI